MIGVALSTRDLVKRYGRRRALDGFTLAVPRGSMMGLVGAKALGRRRGGWPSRDFSA